MHKILCRLGIHSYPKFEWMGADFAERYGLLKVKYCKYCRYIKRKTRKIKFIIK